MCILSTCLWSSYHVLDVEEIKVISLFLTSKYSYCSVRSQDKQIHMSAHVQSTMESAVALRA
jgi:hypothetical protein